MSSKDLSWTDTSGNTYKYVQKPILQSCIFILLTEACERLAFYGITPNLQSYLVGEFGSPGFVSSTADANQYINLFSAFLYVTPILSAIVADGFLGIFWTIIVFSLIYLIGLMFLTLSALTFDKWMLDLGFMVLMTLGAGGIKGCINVFGGQQFHPELQKKQLTTFFTYFYAMINIGGLIGGVICPILQVSVSWFVGFLVPSLSFLVAFFILIFGYKKYIMMKPQGSVLLKVIRVYGSAIRKLSFEKCKKSQGGKYMDNFIEDAKTLLFLLPIFSITLPFNISYGQMSTTWLTQAKKMDKIVFGWDMPASQMQNADSIAVILGCVFIDQMLYKYLQKRGKMPSILHRFALGCTCGILAMASAFSVEKAIIASADNPETISIFWQVPQFIFIALGEIFLISTTYEVAYSHAPDSLKACSSALNLLFMALANFASAFLTAVFASWQTGYNLTGANALVTIEDKKTAILAGKYDLYFVVLAGLCLIGLFAALACDPFYKRFIARVEEQKRVNLKNSEA